MDLAQAVAWPTSPASIRRVFPFGRSNNEKCPLFVQIAQMGLILPRLQFILPTFKFRPGKGVFWGWVECVMAE